MENNNQNVPVSLLIDDFEGKIIQTINSSNLHPSIMLLSLQKIMNTFENEVNSIKNNEYKVYQDSQQEAQQAVPQPEVVQPEITEDMKDREPIEFTPDFEEVE